MTHPDEPEFTREQLEAVPAEEPPAGFAERVTTAWREEREGKRPVDVAGIRPRRRAGFWWAASFLAAAAAGLLWILLTPAGTEPVAPEAPPPAPLERETVASVATAPAGDDAGLLPPMDLTPRELESVPTPASMARPPSPEDGSPDSEEPACHRLAKAREYDRALACYRRTLEKHPEDANTHKNIGVMYAKLGRMDEAAASFRKFIELAPNHPMAPPVRRLLIEYEMIRGEDAPSYSLESPPPQGEPDDTIESGDPPETLPKTVIHKTMKNYLPGMKGCVEQQMQRDPSVEGIMLVTFTIQPDGTSSDVRVLSEEHDKTYVAGCMMYIFKSMKFPRFTGEPIVVPRVPFRLGKKKPDRIERDKKETLKHAKNLYEEAYVIKSVNPEKALINLGEALKLLPPDEIYYRDRIKKLMKRILGSSPDDGPGFE